MKQRQLWVIVFFFCSIMGCMTSVRLKTPAEQKASLPQEARPLVLVLGPGLARSFASMGVLLALHEKKIPIAAIFGAEMGALFGAIYANNPDPDAFEWSLLELRAEELFQQTTGIFSYLKSGGHQKKKQLESRLKHIFSTQKIESLKIPFQLVAQSKSTGRPIVFQQGPLVELLCAGLAIPGLFAPWEYLRASPYDQETIELISAGSTRPFLIEEAQQLGLGPVIVVDTLLEGDELLWTEELKKADVVIRPTLKDVSYVDFNKKMEVIWEGKKALQKAWEDIENAMNVYRAHVALDTGDSVWSNFSQWVIHQSAHLFSRAQI